MPREHFLSFAPPLIGDEEIAEVSDTLRSDWITTGPKTRRFEEAFARYLDAPGGTSLMLNSCTAGLHVALVALGIGPGDEVIVPTLTFAATANVVEHVGAKPVLVDVRADTLCIDPGAVRRAVTPRTRAIIPVHYAGQAADLNALDEIANCYGLELIEDAAHALPARYRGQLVGSRANFAAFSFYATKNLTTAEGGALTGHPELLEKARIVSLHGMSKDAWKRYDKAGSWRYDIVMPGFKYNMTDLQASLGLRQLEKLAGFHRRRREIAAAYGRAFATSGALQVPVAQDESAHTWHLYVLRLAPGHPLERDAFIEALKLRNIGTSVHFIPLHRHSYYRDKYGYRSEDFPVAHDSFTRMLSLPLHPRMSDSDVQDVIGAVLELTHVAVAA